jgi:metal-responsive CopG/Arc/MetJ family transcriptional regulator
MELQITVRIPKDLARSMERASRQLHRKRSEVVRMALRAFLEPPRGHAGRPADRVRGLLGSLESKMPDLAEKHRSYILKSLKNGR